MPLQAASPAREVGLGLLEDDAAAQANLAPFRRLPYPGKRKGVFHYQRAMWDARFTKPAA